MEVVNVDKEIEKTRRQLKRKKEAVKCAEEKINKLSKKSTLTLLEQTDLAMTKVDRSNINTDIFFLEEQLKRLKADQEKEEQQAPQP